MLPSECETFLVNKSNTPYKKATLIFPPKIKSIRLTGYYYKVMVLNSYYFSRYTDVKVIVDFGLKIYHLLGTSVDGDLFHYYLTLTNKIKDNTTVQDLWQYMKMLIKIKRIIITVQLMK